MLSLFTLPNANTVVSSSSNYASGMTTEFLPILYIVIGTVSATLTIVFLRQKLLDALDQGVHVNGGLLFRDTRNKIHYNR